MKTLKSLIAGLTAPFLLASCANTDAISEADRNQFVTEFYAYVYEVNEVRFESDVGPAAASWGLWGALENSHGNSEDIIGGALVGAFFGGLFQAIAEGPRDGYEYHLDAIDGDRVTVIVDHDPADVGQCVKVRISGSVSIYAQPQEACELLDDEQY